MQKQYDFTRGNLLKQLIFFSGPIILANLLQTSYQLIDSLWVGNLLGAGALGAVSVSGVIVFTVLSFVIGLNNAALTILSQQKGSDNVEGLKRYLNAFVVILIIMSLSFTIIGVLATDLLLQILGMPEDTFSMAKEYLQINFIGVIFLFGYNFISTVLRAIGDSKSPLVFVFIAVLLNAVLDPLFIAVFDLGVSGAAYATIISQGAAFAYGMYFVLKNKLAPFEWPRLPKWKEVALILNLGIPAGLQMAVISAGSAAIMSVVTKFGSSIVGGYGAAQRLSSTIMLPAQSLGTSVNSMAGQNIGVNDWTRVQKITKNGLVYNIIFMCTIGLGVFIFTEPLVRLFIQDQAAVTFASDYLRIMVFCFPFLGINFVLNGIIRASGAMYQVLILNIISFWILRFPLAWIFADLLGERGIAAGIGASFIASSLIAASYYQFGKWRQKELFKEHEG